MKISQTQQNVQFTGGYHGKLPKQMKKLHGELKEYVAGFIQNEPYNLNSRVINKNWGPDKLEMSIKLDSVKDKFGKPTVIKEDIELLNTKLGKLGLIDLHVLANSVIKQAKEATAALAKKTK